MSEPMDLIYKDPKYPSSKVVNGLSMAGPRAHLRGMGLVNEELAKPFIGVINTYNEMHPGHIHLNRIGQLVKDGVREAGGVPFEVNTISLCDGFSQGHVGMCSVLPSREVIADSIEVYAGGHQLDGLVLIGGCDKIVPAMIMAALRINLPTVLVTGGPMMPAVYKGKQYGTYELKEMAGKLTRGEISREEYEYMEGLMSPTPGSCAMMGTANTMSIIAEAMGLTMPGSACAHAVSGKKNRVAKESGMAVVRLVEEDIRPRDIVTQEMLELAVRVGVSVGGSTNMTLHMPAIAHEAKLRMSLEEIGRLSAETPYLAKIKPSGSHTMLDLDQAGGVGAVMRELDGLINLDQMTVNGKTHRQNVERVVEHNPEVIRPVSDAYSDHGSITVLKGNLAPDGAVIKQSAVAAAMRRHSGPARCFECEEDAVKAIYGGAVQHGEVLVIRNEGPQGGPGMREMLTATAALVGMGFSESVALVTDGRTHVLVDAGISCRRICTGLKELGVEPTELAGVLITHEHSDHISGLTTLTKQLRLPVYASPGTGRQLCYRIAFLEELLRPVAPGEGFSIGGLAIESFPTSHDAAESVGYALSAGGRKAGTYANAARKFFPEPHPLHFPTFIWTPRRKKNPPPIKRRLPAGSGGACWAQGCMCWTRPASCGLSAASR